MQYQSDVGAESARAERRESRVRLSSRIEVALILTLGLLCFAGLRQTLHPALAQDPLIVETHRIRLTNQPGAPVEVSLDGGRTWSGIGKVVRPATVSAVGARTLEAALPSTVAGAAPESIVMRVPTTLAAPRSLRIDAATEAANNAAIGTDIGSADSLFRCLAPTVGSRVFLERDGRHELLPTNYLPKVGDRLVIVCERSPDTPAAVVVENKKGGLVLMVTQLGEEKRIGVVRQPLQGIGRYAGTERAGQGAVVAFQAPAVLISTASRIRRFTPENKPIEDRGGFVIQPAESELKGATHPHSQVLVEAVAEEGRPKPSLSSLFGLPIPLSSGIPTDTASTRVEVRIDGGEWEPMPDLRGGVDAADFPRRLAESLGKDRMVKDGITHIRITPGSAPLVAYRHFVRLSGAPMAANGVQRGRVTITANAMGNGIAFVSFYLDGVLAKVTNQPPFVWEWDTTRALNGAHLIEIRGADEKGAVVNSVLTRVLIDN